MMATTMSAPTQQPHNRLTLLETSGQLSILQLAASIVGPDEEEAPADTDKASNGARTSDASSYADEASTPASLAADLTHYKELFSKLRFSYLEQVTKERFLRAITAQTPLFIEASDNIALEAQLAQEKLALKQQKAEVAQLTQELENKGRALARRYAALREQRDVLKEMPAHLEALQGEIDELRAAYPSPTKSRVGPDGEALEENAEMNLSLADTLALLSKRQAELAQVDAEIANLQEEMPVSARELERLNDELTSLGQQKNMAVARAREARERKEAGGMDEVERRGRWLRTTNVLMRDMLDIES